MSALEHNFHTEFAASKATKWVATETGRVTGQVRSAGGGGFGAGNVTFVEVFEAGCVKFDPRVLVIRMLNTILLFRHMVPFDQPEAALVRSFLTTLQYLWGLTRFLSQDLISRWINDASLTSN